MYQLKMDRFESPTRILFLLLSGTLDGRSHVVLGAERSNVPGDSRFIGHLSFWLSAKTPEIGMTYYLSINVLGETLSLPFFFRSEFWSEWEV